MTYFVPTALILLVAFASAFAETNEQESESLNSSELSPKRNEKGKSFQKKMFLKAVAYPMILVLGGRLKHPLLQIMTFKFNNFEKIIKFN